jgi:hypothetical protein
MLQDLAVLLKEVLLRVKKRLKGLQHNFLIHKIPNVKAGRKHCLDWTMLEMNLRRHINFIRRIARVTGF